MILLPALLVTLLLAPFLLTDFIPLTFDLFLYFYPYKEAAARAWAEARVPLWNPHLFLGVPFLGNLQTAFFYPPNVLLYPLSAPAQVKWSTWLHLALAASLTYAYLRRSLGVGRAGAALGGTLFGLGGHLGALAEHPNQLAASVWLPAVLLLIDLGGRWVPVLGAVLGLALLAGHAQAVYIVLAGAGLHALVGHLRWQGPRRWPGRGRALEWVRGVLRWLGRGRAVEGVRPAAGPGGRAAVRAAGVRLATLAGGLALAALLAGVQLLPALDLSRNSLRAGGLPYFEAVSFSLSPRLLLQAALPPSQPGLFSEFVAYVGVAGLVLAVLGLSHPRAAWPAILAGAGLLLALGGYNPLYFVLWKLVPGFDLFRAPARWLLLFAWGASVLAALGFERLRQGHRLTRPGRRVEVALLLFLLLQAYPAPRSLLVWAVAAAGAVAALRQPAHRAAVSLALLAGLELVWGMRFQGYQQLVPPDTYHGRRPALSFLATREQPARVLGFSGLTWDPGDLGSLQEGLPPETAYQAVVATKEKEIAAPNLPLARGFQTLDGYDGGLLPTAGFYRLTERLLPEIDPQRRPLDGRLWQHLRWPPDEELLDLLAVDYLLMDKLHDLWLADVYYDLAFEVRGPATIAGLPGFPATALGVVFRDGARLRAAGETLTLKPGGQPVLSDERGAFYQGVLSWGEPRAVETIELEEGAVHGLSLIDERTGTFEPLVAAPRGRWRLVHSGDVKIYHNLDARSRVWPGRVTHYEPGLVRARVEGPATAVLAESLLPGWRVSLDGRPALLLEAEPFFPAVEVPPGQHTVVFEYRPASYVWGLRASLAGLALLAAAGAASLWYRRV